MTVVILKECIVWNFMLSMSFDLHQSINAEESIDSMDTTDRHCTLFHAGAIFYILHSCIWLRCCLQQHSLRFL